MEFSKQQKEYMLSIARNSIEYGLENHKPMKINYRGIPEYLCNERATFVTLQQSRSLRGCIGTLEAYRPLIEDIVNNAFTAAFLDNRFVPLTASELNDIDIKISILSKPRRIPCNSQDELLEQLNMGEDGLIIKEGSLKATFLPSVWDDIPNKIDFVTLLKNKAGLASDYWSEQIECFSYQVEYF